MYDLKYRVKNRAKIAKRANNFRYEKRQKTIKDASDRYEAAQNLLASIRSGGGQGGTSGAGMVPSHTQREKAAIRARLKLRLKAARQESKIEKQGNEGGTIGVAETTLPLAVKTFQAASPGAGGDSQDEIFSFFLPPTRYPKAQSHAE